MAHGSIRPFVLVLIGWLIAPTLVAGAAKADETAIRGETAIRNVVEQLNTTLLDVMQSADQLGFEGRYQTLEPVLRKAFDFPAMARIASGRSWNDFEVAQRDQLAERFAQMSIATFAARFDGHNGEQFEIRGQKPGPRGTVIVDDRIIRVDEPSVGLNFVMRERKDAPEGEAWRIIDVMLDGKFSELARQRAEFAAVLKKGGFDRLIEAIDAKITALNPGA